MKQKYQGNQRVQSAQLQRLRRDFEVLEMKEGEAILEYFSRVMRVVNDMRNLGEEMADSKVVEKILRMLVEKFTYVVCAIEESNDIKDLTVDGLQSSLMVHEQKLIRHVGEEHALRYKEDGSLMEVEVGEVPTSEDEEDIKAEEEEAQASIRRWLNATSVTRRGTTSMSVQTGRRMPIMQS
ncbi:uncharacterized protein LOC130498954 [Raphanus sativus]|uniref:Uncharacterized protein LOC130498954 n=1 Tax=Raphanus sativus TaxID=3726 RepID=A0A9W3CBJ2_RAPSA|nr:uncharacterized protein LOC130498954 [Raphanus sativus]